MTTNPVAILFPTTYSNPAAPTTPAPIVPPDVISAAGVFMGQIISAPGPLTIMCTQAQANQVCSALAPFAPGCFPVMFVEQMQFYTDITISVNGASPVPVTPDIGIWTIVTPTELLAPDGSVAFAANTSIGYAAMLFSDMKYGESIGQFFWHGEPIVNSTGVVERTEWAIAYGSVSSIPKADKIASLQAIISAAQNQLKTLVA